VSPDVPAAEGGTLAPAVRPAAETVAAASELPQAGQNRESRGTLSEQTGHGIIAGT
jgi:hypothetical protein